MAQAALYRAADMHMEFCERAAQEGIPFGYGDDHLVGAIAREAYILRLGGHGAGDLAHRGVELHARRGGGCSACSATWR